jgi:hypothetical protein
MSTVVEFIGLVVFATQAVTGGASTANPVQKARFRFATVPPQRVIALMPRVPDRVDWTTAEAASASVSRRVLPSGMMERSAPPPQRAGAIAAHAMVTSAASAVEAHTAMLAYKHQDLVASSGWGTPPSLTTGYDYVELKNGEQVTFVPDLPNVPVNSLLQVPLVHLGPTPLLPRYQAPYAGTAAVFSIPAGQLSACTHGSRIDTTLTLNTQHSLTIKVGTKSLTFADGALVLAANVPFTYANTGTESATSAGNHYMVYCAMQGKPANQCMLSAVMAPAAPNCGAQFRVMGRPTEPQPPSFVMDWACSNSQWP